MKLKSLFLTSVLSLLFISGAFAQDKYEYASVSGIFTGTLKNGKLVISKANSFEEIEIKVDKGNLSTNLSPFLACIEKMGEQGWEVFDVNYTTGSYPTYHLRKKKN